MRRVEAACKAYQAAQNEDPYDFKGRISAALAAADALLTEEMIAETAHKAMQESWTDSEEYEHAPAYIARAVLALIRGGEKR